mmetsp:Transcript_16696/g.42754  ORF Transcript_16696/g.42754 Transcript_16696/m.42754 type:complete len:209 (+) Transcript_16696:893-1519(+)
MRRRKSASCVACRSGKNALSFGCRCHGGVVGDVDAHVIMLAVHSRASVDTHATVGAREIAASGLADLFSKMCESATPHSASLRRARASIAGATILLDFKWRHTSVANQSSAGIKRRRASDSNDATSCASTSCSFAAASAPNVDQAFATSHVALLLAMPNSRRLVSPPSPVIGGSTCKRDSPSTSQVTSAMALDENAAFAVLFVYFTVC